MIFTRIQELIEGGTTNVQIIISPAPGGQLQVAAIFGGGKLSPLVLTGSPQELDFALASGSLEAPLTKRQSLQEQLLSDKATLAASAEEAEGRDEDAAEATHGALAQATQPAQQALRAIARSDAAAVEPTLDLFGFNGQPTAL